MASETTTFDVHDCKVYALTDDPADGPSATFGAAVDVPAVSNVSVDPNLITAELKGDGKVVAKRGKVDRFNFSATYGKIALDVLDTILDGTRGSDTGSESFAVMGDNSLPYFKIEFKIEDVDEGVGDLHVILPKCQITGGTLVSGQTDSFGQPTMQVEAIPLQSTDQMIDVQVLDAATDLSA